MENVWITGGTGFFGSHIAAQLGKGAVTTTRDQVDLLDVAQVSDFVERVRSKTIVHAAGFVGGMQLMKNEPGRMYDDNLRMGQNVLQAAAKKGGIHVVLIGTALSYPEESPVPTPESVLFQGPLQKDSAAYGKAKLELLNQARSEAANGSLDFTYLIPTNMYGPRNHLEPDRSNVIASLFLRALKAKQENDREFVVWGDGGETRDFLFVEDAAHAVQLSLEKKPRGEVLNLGSGKETSIADLAQRICKVVGYEGKLVFDPSKGGGARRRCLDTRHAEQTLGFRATTSLEEGLRKTFEWIKEQT